MPSILFINRVYPPESGATGRVLEYVAHGFVKAGWDVSMLTTAGDHSSAGSSMQDGVKVIRIGSSFSKKSLLARALGYALMIPSLLLKSLTLPKADLVVTKTDPPMLLVIGPVLKLIKGSRLIHWAQDLYPEVAEEAGVFPKKGAVANILRGLSSWSMSHHDLIIAVGRCMEERIKGRGIPRAKIRVIPNIGVERDIVPIPHSENDFRKAQGLNGNFVIMYSGNMGRAHEFETVIDAALKLQNSGEAGDDRVVFLFVGDGPGKPSLQEEVKRTGMENIRFLPSQPSDQLSASLGAADLHLVTMKTEMSGLVVPSKLYGVMAAARPCLFIGPKDSEAALMIEELRSGMTILPGDGSALVLAIRDYCASPQRAAEEGDRARSTILQAGALPAFLQVGSSVLNSRPI